MQSNATTVHNIQLIKVAAVHKPQVALQRKVGHQLMEELEAALCEYLCYNWDRPDEVFAANQHHINNEGLSCAKPGGATGPVSYQGELGGQGTIPGSPSFGQLSWTFKRRSSSAADLAQG